MSDPRRLMDPKHMEAIASLRHALQLLDCLDLAEEAALVSQALEMLKAAAPISRAATE